MFLTAASDTVAISPLTDTKKLCLAGMSPGRGLMPALTMRKSVVIRLTHFSRSALMVPSRSMSRSSASVMRGTPKMVHMTYPPKV